MSYLPEFLWVKERFPHTIMSYNAGDYIDRTTFRWFEEQFSPPKAQEILFQLTQSDGWLIERVLWGWFEGCLGMQACTLVRHRARRPSVIDD